MTSHVVVTQYTVSPVPLDHPDMMNAHNFCIEVVWRGEDQWAVKHLGYTLTGGGDWEYEPRPSAREDDYLARCRFDKEAALRLAREALPTIVVNGMTWADWEVRRDRVRAPVTPYPTPLPRPVTPGADGAT